MLWLTNYDWYVLHIAAEHFSEENWVYDWYPTFHSFSFSMKINSEILIINPYTVTI